MLIRMQNISISKSDWDAQENELVRLSKEVQHSCCTNPCTNPCNENVNTNVVRQECRTSCRLADLMEACKEYWTEQFLRLHANEEELIEELRELH